MRGRILVASMCTLGLVASTHAAMSPHQAPQPVTGMWGGQGIRLDASESGARLQVECFVARHDAPLTLDREGRFAVNMTFAAIGGAQTDEETPRPTSRVAGHVEGPTLRLTISPADHHPSGTFTLEHNAKATLPNCRLRG